MRNDSAAMAGEASTTRFTLVVLKVTMRAERSMLAPAGSWLPRRCASAGLTRGPGAPANRVPMMVPGSVPAAPPIMWAGRSWPRIQPGAPVPPVIHW
jgi:hypothetical protein